MDETAMSWSMCWTSWGSDSLTIDSTAIEKPMKRRKRPLAKPARTSYRMNPYVCEESAFHVLMYVA